MKHHFALIWYWVVKTATDWLPDAPLFMRLRGWLYGLPMRRRGKDFQVASSVRLNGLDNISVGDHVYIAPGAVLLAGCDITIEDEVMIAPYAVITDGNHTALDGSYRFAPVNYAPVFVGRGSWIAANCTVLSGVHIGRGVVIAANSAVTHAVPDGCLVGGVPARVIRAPEAETSESERMPLHRT